MTVVVRFTNREEAKALPILLRHSPGLVLPARTYVLRQEAVDALKDAGVRFTEVSRESSLPAGAGAIAGERI
jgi:hypothetical protein